MRILLADHAIHEFRAIQEMISGWGHTLLAARNGQEAMNRLRTEPPPDLLMVDRALPGMDGLSLCRWARKHLTPRTPHLVVLSQPGSPALPELASSAGVDALILKPLEVTLLREQLAYAEIALQQNLAVLRRRFASTRISASV